MAPSICPGRVSVEEDEMALCREKDDDGDNKIAIKGFVCAALYLSF